MAQRLIAKLARETNLDANSRVLDLGCGPGSLTLPLSRYCGTTIGIDADAAMIAAAEQASALAGLPIEWRVGSSFDLGDDLAPLDLVTIARAFHWMDRAATLRRLDALIAPGGAVALVNTELHPSGSSNWHKAFEELRNAHGRFDDFYRWRKSEAWEEHTSVLMRSAFSEVERISVFEARTPKLEEIVARALSFSANSPAALGDDGRSCLRGAGARAHAGHCARRRFSRDRRKRRHHRPPSDRIAQNKNAAGRPGGILTWTTSGGR